MSLRNRLVIRALVLGFVAATIGGCAASPNKLTMTSVDRRKNFTQIFSRAYAAWNVNGDYDIVLLHDANADKLSTGGGPVDPGPVPPRQVVYIRVFWNAESGTKMDHPVATNALITWYLFGNRSDESAHLLEYRGRGLVLVSESRHTASVTIRGAAVTVIARRGDMSDPLGPSSINGTITAELDRGQLDDVLNEVRSAADIDNAPGEADTFEASGVH